MMATCYRLRAIAAVVFLGIIIPCSALECFICSNATAVSECKSTQVCGMGEICFAEYSQISNGISYTFGCRAETACGAISVVSNATTQMPMNLVGRSTSAGPCVECCKEPHCNRHLCQHSSMECSDSTELDCVTLDKLLNICADTKRANTVCRRFCGLCFYSDGNWSNWSGWSNCDVTCGNGTQTKLRTCTNPPPSPDGSPCDGPDHNSQTCTLQKCPVPGGWAQWNTWGSCSVSCGIGMQRRDRSCSNPYPERFGDHCFGDSRDDKLCVDAVCPVTDGGWSLWSSWTTCSQSCDSGVYSRSRNCDNPKPSVGGEFCSGTPYEVSGCIIQKCPRISSSFSYSTPSTARRQVYGLMLRFEIGFSAKLQEEGSHFDSTTGVFTCNMPGLYVFVASLTSTHNVDCEIQKNGNPVAFATYTFPSYKYNDQYASQDGGSVTMTASTYTYLLREDKVQVVCREICLVATRSCPFPLFASLTAHSMFSGFLVAADP